MPHRELPILQPQLYLRRELEETEVIGYRGALLPHACRQLLLRQPVGINQLAECEGNLYRIEILALDILDQRHLHHLVVIHGADVGGDRLQLDQSGSSVAPLAADDDVLTLALAILPDGDRLYQPDVLDRRGKLLERLSIEVCTRLIRIGVNGIERQLGDGGGSSGLHLLDIDEVVGEEGVESSSEGGAVSIVRTHEMVRRIWM